MNTILDGIENSPYNNAGALYGVDDAGISNELLGELARMNPIKRAITMQKIVNPQAPSKGSRAEMEKHFRELPAHVAKQLKENDLRLADTIVYSIKPVSSKTVKMFEPQDTKEVGLRTISEARLPKNQVLLVSGIILLAGVAATAGKEDQMRTAFAGIEAIPAIASGEFSLKANKKSIVPEGTSNRNFCTAGFTGVPAGYYKLANPRLIHDDVNIELTIELGTQGGIAANTVLFVGLHGTITTP
jgi:hypothetical protein